MHDRAAGRSAEAAGSEQAGFGIGRRGPRKAFIGRFADGDIAAPLGVAEQIESVVVKQTALMHVHHGGLKSPCSSFIARVIDFRRAGDVVVRLLAEQIVTRRVAAVRQHDEGRRRKITLIRRRKLMADDHARHLGKILPVQFGPGQRQEENNHRQDKIRQPDASKVRIYII